MDEIRTLKARLEELEKSEGRLRAFLESASQGVVAIDPGGSILLVNAKTEELFGYRREELIGAAMEILLPEGLRRQHGGHRDAYFEAPRSRPMGVGMELKGRKKDGTEFPVEISLSFVREGERRLALALITDISERKKLELQMQQTQKLESLGVLAGGVAHDFNNLLTGIVGNASLALEELAPDHPVYPLLEEVVDSGHHAADLTRQLLAYAGKGRFSVKNLDITELVREVMGLVRSSIPATVQVELDLPERLPAVAADTAQMKQLFMNLILNAAEAIGAERGTIRISASVRDVETAPTGRFLAVEVADTGCGMDEATVARIFDPFFTTKFTGRGLGLAAARGIVDAHKGMIQVASRPGKGTTFQVLLPAAQGAATRTTVRESREDLAGSGVVLVVDDEEIIRHTAKAALQRYGYTVLVAEDGRSAIDLVKQAGERLRAVVLDLSMPEMDGAETVRHLKAIRPDLPVLVSSGFGETEVMERLAGAEPAGFLEKPYTAAGLAEGVKRAWGARIRD